RLSPPAGGGVRGDDGGARSADGVLDIRRRTAARVGQPQPHAEPVQGPLVLPGLAGAAALLPPPDRRRDLPHADPRGAGGGSLRGPQPEQPARGPQARHLAVHDALHVRGDAHDHRVVLPGTGVQLGLAVEPGTLLRVMTATIVSPRAVAVMIAAVMVALFLFILGFSLLQTRRRARVAPSGGDAAGAGTEG